MDETTDLFGIPIPSTDRTFIAFVIVHILIALVAVISGLVAMLSEKTGRLHPRAGIIYYWSMVTSFVLIVVLSVMRWPHNIHLLTIGFFALVCTYFGKQYAKLKVKRVHTILMGMSYVFLLTGFYVDNGKNLPFWNLFPEWFFYIFPISVGTPIIIRVLKRHPLNFMKR